VLKGRDVTPVADGAIWRDGRSATAFPERVPSEFTALRQAAIAATLRSAQIFSGLPEAELATIAGFAQLRDLDKDAYLFREGDPSEGFYVVRKGALNVHRVSATGKEQVIYVFRAGESLAEASVAGDRGYPANARALEATTVVVIPRKPFLALLAREPELGLRMLGSMSQHLRVLVGLVEDLTLKDVETRFLNWLLKRCKAGADGSATVQLGLTKRSLAAELGTSGETLSRTFARLRAGKLLVVSGQTLRVPDVTALRSRMARLLGEV
jgi:CRP-like cAMP-binding protein